jgi:hypothetical protein
MKRKSVLEKMSGQMTSDEMRQHVTMLRVVEQQLDLVRSRLEKRHTGVDDTDVVENTLASVSVDGSHQLTPACNMTESMEALATPTCRRPVHRGGATIAVAPVIGQQRQATNPPDAFPSITAQSAIPTAMCGLSTVRIPSAVGLSLAAGNSSLSGLPGSPPMFAMGMVSNDLPLLMSQLALCSANIQRQLASGAFATNQPTASWVLPSAVGIPQYSQFLDSLNGAATLSPLAPLGITTTPFCAATASLLDHETINRLIQPSNNCSSSNNTVPR